MRMSRDKRTKMTTSRAIEGRVEENEKFVTL